MSKGIPAALLICIAVGVGFYLYRSAPSRHSKALINVERSSATQTNSNKTLAERAPEATNRLVEFAPATTALAAAAPSQAPIQSKSSGAVAGVSAGTELNDTNLPPSLVLENLRSAIRNYGQRMGGNPVGNNAEITKALNGGNPREVQYLAPEKGMRMNANGELIDPWGTPYFFHQLSGTQMEIRSAGPDKKMWTADDLLTE
jgi:hypothetical protein